MFYARDAIIKGANTFLSGSTSGSGFDLAHAFDSNSTRVDRLYGWQLGTSAMLERPLASRLHLTGHSRASIGSGRLRLPDGAGVLIEPIIINFTSLITEADLGIGQDIPISSNTTLGISTHIGVQAALSNTRINSPVISIENNSAFADPYIGAQLEMRRKPANPASGQTIGIDVDFRYYRTMGQTLSAGISIGY
jgi:hypothetical protein